MFWKENGTVSSAVFNDSHGTSVDRLGDRTESDAVDALHRRMPDSGIVSVTYQNCLDALADVKYVPFDDNPYHSEIHKNSNEVKLTKSQRKRLAENANVIIKITPLAE